MRRTAKLTAALFFGVALCSAQRLSCQVASTGAETTEQGGQSAGNSVLSSGIVTVRFTDGLDSANEPPGAVSDATVERVQGADVPVGTMAKVRLVADAQAGGFTVVLFQLQQGATVIRTNSSQVTLAETWADRLNAKLREPGAPKADTVSGARVFLPQGAVARFTLTAPPPESQQQTNQHTDVLVGSDSFNPATAQQLDLPAVAALRERLLAGNALAMLKADKVQMYLNPTNARENIIANGSLQHVPECCFRGLRMMDIYSGQVVKVLDFRAITDGAHDILQLVIESPFPLFGNIAFVFPKGALASMTEQQLIGILQPWFQLRSDVAAASVVPQTPNQHADSINQWSISVTRLAGTPADEDPRREVVLPGIASFKSKDYPVLLALECSSNGSSTLAIRFPTSLETQSQLGDFEGPSGVGMDERLLSFTVGSVTTMPLNVSGGEYVDNMYDLDFIPSRRLLLQLIGPPGTPLSIKVLPSNNKEVPLTAHFSLPASNLVYRSFAAPCLRPARSSR